MASNPPIPTDAAISQPTLLQQHRLALEPYLPLSSSSSSSQQFHLTLTYAQSLDGQISFAPGIETALSGRESRAMAHYLRSRHDAILVGVGTAEADDPSLNCRLAADDGHGSAEGEEKVLGVEKQPRPIILDPSGRWSCREDCKVVSLAKEKRGKGPWWFVSAENANRVSAEQLKVLEAVGGELVARDEFWEAGSALDRLVGARRAGVHWGVILKRLHIMGINSLMVEGGGKVIEDLLRRENQELVDSVIVTIAPVWLGRGGVLVSAAREAEKEVARLERVGWIQIGDDTVMAGRFKPQSNDRDLLL